MDICYDKVKFKQSLYTNPALQGILEGKFQPKEVTNIYKEQKTSNFTPEKSNVGTYTQPTMVPTTK